MKTASRVCENCGETIFGDVPKGLCPACVLETGLGPLTNEAVAGIDDPGHAPFSLRIATHSNHRALKFVLRVDALLSAKAFAVLFNRHPPHPLPWPAVVPRLRDEGGNDLTAEPRDRRDRRQSRDGQRRASAGSERVSI